MLGWMLKKKHRLAKRKQNANVEEITSGFWRRNEVSVTVLYLELRGYRSINHTVQLLCSDMKELMHR